MTSHTRYHDYDSFAAIYNKHWGGFAIRIIPILEDLALKQMPCPARILDLCCGTGQLAQALSTRGYQVTGVDGSEEMLSFAKKNAPEGAFILADARDFDVGSGYDVVFSTYDSLNHVMTLEGLSNVFTNVHRSLSPGGVFVFDLNVAEGYVERWRGSFGFSEETYALIATSHYEADDEVATAEYSLFFRDPAGDCWTRKDLTFTQRAYPTPDIISALKNAGFNDITTHTPMQGRVFFVAK